jgi:hypothetical protein
MRAIQSSFPLFKDCSDIKIMSRKLLLKMMILLYNLCAKNMVDTNQIRNMYMPVLNVNANRVYVYY